MQMNEVEICGQTRRSIDYSYKSQCIHILAGSVAVRIGIGGWYGIIDDREMNGIVVIGRVGGMAL